MEDFARHFLTGDAEPRALRDPELAEGKLNFFSNWKKVIYKY